VGTSMIYADYKCGKHTNEDIDVTYDGVTDSIIDELTGLSYRNSADKVEGDHVDFGHIRLNKDDFDKKILGLKADTAARVDFVLCQAGLAAEFSNIPGIHKYREHTYRFPCTAVKGD